MSLQKQSSSLLHQLIVLNETALTNKPTLIAGTFRFNYIFSSVPAMIKDIRFQGGGSIDGVEQFTVYCIHIPQTVSYLTIIMFTIILL